MPHFSDAVLDAEEPERLRALRALLRRPDAPNRPSPTCEERFGAPAQGAEAPEARKPAMACLGGSSDPDGR